jgi:hypothetical protein
MNDDVSSVTHLRSRTPLRRSTHPAGNPHRASSSELGTTRFGKYLPKPMIFNGKLTCMKSPVNNDHGQ